MSVGSRLLEGGTALGYPYPMIVFVHGLEGSPQGRKAQRLRALGLPLQVRDLRGVSLQGRYDAVERDTRGGRALLVGSSYGGLVAALLAQAHPERFTGLVLCAPARGGWSPPTSTPGRWSRRPVSRSTCSMGFATMSSPSNSRGPTSVARGQGSPSGSSTTITPCEAPWSCSVNGCSSCGNRVATPLREACERARERGLTPRSGRGYTAREPGAATGS
jgi:pimeloyl-ACP methyl ester carboxylesterase